MSFTEFFCENYVVSMLDKKGFHSNISCLWESEAIICTKLISDHKYLNVLESWMPLNLL